ncbi:hypothetical protein MRB53_038101 [Persea americana]|nr:hypothetical protein MRB53_038101 [Persea americana]
MLYGMPPDKLTIFSEAKDLDCDLLRGHSPNARRDVFRSFVCSNGGQLTTELSTEFLQSYDKIAPVQVVEHECAVLMPDAKPSR